MRLYHITPRRNKLSILERGILLSLARCVPPAVWLCRRAVVERMLDHVRRRHLCDDVCVVMVEVRFPRGSARPGGLVSITRDVPARSVKGELFVEV